ncbi:tRNA dihydrouridine(20/20a) synthase DusA [Acaryochloris sp. IP29b_bin.148]|uniref:tRNA dihydrouridine(20/20a) synthase DusA n=1 Tax=Acaryochloris sp. IP29b_bin.148 TaxID=2969218 RepID=UPI002610308B|nr:tRNA dihydrouridine(20/20a) synthase DusA [Acaryochloris sp. IP29b_bin.148]
MAFSSPSERQYPISVAPMMDRTDRHFRYFMRQITQRTLLYTEMVTSAAILNGDRQHLLDFSPIEKPLVLQVGGDNPRDLAECARIAQDWDYDEINLNVGCPSSRVQNGHFGACLMAQPERVAACVEAMMQATDLPVSVKHRIGIDECDRYEDMAHFVQTVATTGCQIFSVHARKAWLQGLSPKENRNIPPLRYADVHQLKQEFSHLWIEINGGFTQLFQVQDQLQTVDAVMIGRAAYDNPYLFAAVDRDFYDVDEPTQSRGQVAQAMMNYLEEWKAKGLLKPHSITRHMLQLFVGQPGSRAWKRVLTEQGCQPNAGPEIIHHALDKVCATTAGLTS